MKFLKLEYLRRFAIALHRLGIQSDDRKWLFDLIDELQDWEADVIQHEIRTAEHLGTGEDDLKGWCCACEYWKEEVDADGRDISSCMREDEWTDEIVGLANVEACPLWKKKKEEGE